MFRIVLLVIWIVVAAAALAAGWNYYQLPLESRLYDPAHSMFAPTGWIGQGYGVIGTLMIVVGVVTYTARKRMSALDRFGSLKGWLQFHIFLCTLGPFLVLLHTTFKFGGLVSISFWSMMAVVASGIFGRYVYAWLPKSADGRRRDSASVRRERAEMLDTLSTVTELTRADVTALVAGPSAPPGLLGSVVAPVRFHLSSRQERRRAGRLLRSRGVPTAARDRILKLLDSERRLTRQLTLVGSFQRLFRYWHAFHLPLTVVMFVVLAVHVGVAVAFGYTWIF